MSHPVRTCPICQASDDHPRHVVSIPGGGNNGEDLDLPYHMTCHARMTNCDVCHAQLEGVGGVNAQVSGDELRAHLATTGPGPDQPGWTAPTGADPTQEG